MRRFDHNQGAAKSCKREPTYSAGVSVRDEGPTILPQSSARSQPNPQSMEELYLPPSVDPRPAPSRRRRPRPGRAYARDKKSIYDMGPSLPPKPPLELCGFLSVRDISEGAHQYG